MSYIPLDISAAFDDAKSPEGQTSHIKELDNVFKWMPGFVNGWYGWSNDGKGTFTDFLMVAKAKYSKWKFCLYKQEDMDTIIDESGKPQIKGNGIYLNLAWTLGGHTWNESFARRNQCRVMDKKEKSDWLDFITSHFFVIYPKDRKFNTLMEEFQFMYEKFGVNAFMLDPWNTVQLPDGKRDDEKLIDAFIEIKEFALKTNTVFNIISHPRSMSDVRDGKKKDSPFKIVTQFMQLGGAAWDIKMDGQYSIYRPERHLDAADPKVHFYNLKQRKAEIVGAKRGEYTHIVFDEKSRQYYFDGVNPITGKRKDDNELGDIFSVTPPTTPPSDDLPF